MGINKHSPGCLCCDCWRTTKSPDFDITLSSVTGGRVFSDQMPTSSQWTALYEPFDSVSADSDNFIFGANATLTTGYRVDITRSTTSNGSVLKYTVELYNLGTSTVDATKEFYRFGTTSTVSLNLPVFLHHESCAGAPYTTTIYVVVGDVFCFEVEATGTYWGVDGSVGFNGFGYGAKDRLLVAFNDDPCHLCGVQEESFGGSSGVCVGDTLRVTISDLPTSSYTFTSGSTNYTISSISGNGTYNNAAVCPDCRYPNVLAEIVSDIDTTNPAFSETRTVALNATPFSTLIPKDDYRQPMSPSLDNSDIRLIVPEPAFLSELFTAGPDDGFGTKYQQVGLCKWEKYKRDVATNGNSFAQRMARIVIEYV